MITDSVNDLDHILDELLRNYNRNDRLLKTNPNVPSRGLFVQLLSHSYCFQVCVVCVRKRQKEASLLPPEEQPYWPHSLQDPSGSSSNCVLPLQWPAVPSVLVPNCSLSGAIFGTWLRLHS